MISNPLKYTANAAFIAILLAMKGEETSSLSGVEEEVEILVSSRLEVVELEREASELSDAFFFLVAKQLKKLLMSVRPCQLANCSFNYSKYAKIHTSCSAWLKPKLNTKIGLNICKLEQT